MLLLLVIYLFIYVVVVVVVVTLHNSGPCLTAQFVEESSAVGLGINVGSGWDQKLRVCTSALTNKETK